MSAASQRFQLLGKKVFSDKAAFARVTDFKANIWSFSKEYEEIDETPTDTQVQHYLCSPGGQDRNSYENDPNVESVKNVYHRGDTPPHDGDE